jgi:hypothetical protein
LSTWYRGNRYGFSPQSEYIPLLDRYCQKYTHSVTKESYYGYVDSEYISPVLVNNIITNPEFKGGTGWLGTYIGSTPKAKPEFGATIEPVYGRFVTNSGFFALIDDLSSGAYSEDTVYKKYLKFSYPDVTANDEGIIINSGFSDNIAEIKNVEDGELWILKTKIVDAFGNPIVDSLNDYFTFTLQEVSYNSTRVNYNILNGITATVDESKANADGIVTNILKFSVSSKLSDEAFSNKNIKLVIRLNKPELKGNYYYLE